MQKAFVSFLSSFPTCLRVLRPCTEKHKSRDTDFLAQASYAHATRVGEGSVNRPDILAVKVTFSAMF